jgi:hypothetical protein
MNEHKKLAILKELLELGDGNLTAVKALVCMIPWQSCP